MRSILREENMNIGFISRGEILHNLDVFFAIGIK